MSTEEHIIYKINVLQFNSFTTDGKLCDRLTSIK